MSDITREEAIEVLKLNNPFMAGKDKETFSKAIDKGIEALENQKTGHWIVHPKNIYAHLVCDKCLSNAPYDCRTNYCPNCGAKMEGE